MLLLRETTRCLPPACSISPVRLDRLERSCKVGRPIAGQLRLYDRTAAGASFADAGAYASVAWRPRPYDAVKGYHLFSDEVLTSVKRRLDVLKLERQRLVLPKPRA